MLITKVSKAASEHNKMNDNYQSVKYATMDQRSRNEKFKDSHWSQYGTNNFTNSSSNLYVRRRQPRFSVDDFTLGLSIVQGSDHNVYVKDLVFDGPSARAGIQIGDQVINSTYSNNIRILLSHLRN